MQFVEKYRSLIIKGGWVLCLTALRQALSLVLIMVLVRVLSKGEFGQYQFVVAVIGASGIFTLPGMRNAVTQSVGRGFDGTYRKSIRVVLLSSLLGSAGLASLGVQQWLSGRELLPPAFLIAAALFPFAQGLTHWTSYQAGKEQFRLNAIYQGMGFSASYLGASAAVLLIDPNFILVVLITNAVLAMQNGWLSMSILRRLPLESPVEKGAIPYGVKTSFSLAVNTIGNHFDKLLLFYLLSPEALAVYAIAERIPELIKNYLQSARTVLVPRFSRKSGFTSDMNRKINRLSLGASFGIVLLAIGVVPWLIPLAFTAEYGNAVLYCQLFLGTLVIGQAATMKYTYIISRLDARSVRDVTIGTNIIRILASAILVPIFGIMGAIAATFLYRLATVVMVHISLRKFHALVDSCSKEVEGVGAQ
ncbi:MAG: oligosaccharide flippase family protein [Hyphomicrobiales bacterium]|nr:oligosaccharide flippase family protein [Hyphomicrobiales bacterium]